VNRREAERLTHQENVLLQLGFTVTEAESLRRISMTLRRWYERECGDENGCIERDSETGRPFVVYHRAGYSTQSRIPIPDRERGAEKRLAAIMAKHTGDHCPRCEPGAFQPCGKSCRHVVGKLTAYLQTDPRGAALYILRPGDVPEGESASAYYSRGICVS